MNDLELSNIKSDRGLLVAELLQAGAKFRGNTVFCPFHEDRHPSGGIYEKDGVWRYKCLACGVGGDIFDIRSKVAGSTPAQVMREAVNGPAKVKHSPGENTALAFASLDTVRQYLQAKVGSIVSEHTYTGASADMVQMVFRCESTTGGKTFRPVHLTDKGYILGAAPKPWPLYCLPSIKQAEMVVVVEGEKCADVLTRYGFVSTTSAGGAKNAKSSDWTPLAGQGVTLWPDNDTEGRRYMAEVEQILEALQPAPRVSILDSANLDLGDKEDVADFVKQLKVLNRPDAEITVAIAEALKKAKQRNITGEVQQRVADIASGRWSSIPWPWDCLSSLTRSFQPGTLVLVSGSPGASKSFMTLQAFVYWHEQGLRVALYELEKDKIYWVFRVLAQKTANADLTDDKWVKENSEAAREMCSEHSEFLNGFGRVLFTSPETQPTLVQLAEWVEERAKAGNRIIGIDPVTLAARTAEPWVDDSRFLQSIERSVREHGCSVVLVTHPVKAVSFPDMSQIAGSAAYQRVVDTILWLESHDEKSSKIRMSVGTTEELHDRTLYILKSRYKGMGMRLAYQFDSASLTLSELGFIVKDRKKKETEF